MQSIANVIQRQDIQFFYTLNQKFRNKILDELMKGITLIGTTLFSILMVVCLIIFDRKIGVPLVINLLVSQLIIHVIKRLANRPRPYKTFDWVIAINPPKCKYSLPSAHSGSALTIALVLSLFYPAFSVLFIGIALLVGMSRIYLGVHYPTDVLLGFAISLITFIIV